MLYLLNIICRVVNCHHLQTQPLNDKVFLSTILRLNLLTVGQKRISLTNNLILFMAHVIFMSSAYYWNLKLFFIIGILHNHFTLSSEYPAWCS